MIIASVHSGKADNEIMMMTCVIFMYWHAQIRVGSDLSIIVSNKSAVITTNAQFQWVFDGRVRHALWSADFIIFFKNYKSLISFCITHLWNQLPVSFRQCSRPKPPNHSPSQSPHFTHGSSCASSSFLPPLTPLFHSRLETYHFRKSFQP